MAVVVSSLPKITKTDLVAAKFEIEKAKMRKVGTLLYHII